MRDKRLKAYDLFPMAPSVSITTAVNELPDPKPMHLAHLSPQPGKPQLQHSWRHGSCKTGQGCPSMLHHTLLACQSFMRLLLPHLVSAVYEIQTRQFQPRRHSCSDQSSIYCAVEGTVTTATPFALLTSMLMYG